MSKLGNLISQCFHNAQRLFHMLVGLAFLGLAMAGVTASLSEWHNYLTYPSGGLVRFILFASLTVVLVVFCLYSFVKARSIR